MAHYTCWCLNVTVHLLDEPVGLEWDWPIFKMPGVGMLGIGGVTTMYKELVHEVRLEPQPGKEWNVYSCINCNSVVYAQRKHSTRQVVLNTALLRASENVDDIPGYSPTFLIVLKHRDEVDTSEPLVAATSEQEVLLKRIGELGENALERASEESDERIRNFILEEKAAMRRFRQRVGAEQRAMWQVLHDFQSSSADAGTTNTGKSPSSPPRSSGVSHTELNQLTIGQLMNTLNPEGLDTTDLARSAQSRGDVDPFHPLNDTPPTSPTTKPSPEQGLLIVPGKLKESQEPTLFELNEYDGHVAFEDPDDDPSRDEDEELERELLEIQKSKWAYRKAVEDGKATPTDDDGGLGKHKSPDEKLYSSSLPIAVGSRSVLQEKLDKEDTTAKEETPEPFVVPHELYSQTLAEQSPFSETFDRPTPVTRALLRNE